MRSALAILVLLLVACTSTPPKGNKQIPRRAVVQQKVPPMPLEYMSKGDRALWDLGCAYDELEWGFHGVLAWACPRKK